VAAEVVIEIEASPINQYDLLLIAGGYGTDARPRLDPLMVSIDISDVPSTGASNRPRTTVEKAAILHCRKLQETRWNRWILWGPLSKM
jgi:hypothetical protein